MSAREKYAAHVVQPVDGCCTDGDYDAGVCPTTSRPCSTPHNHIRISCQFHANSSHLQMYLHAPFSAPFVASGSWCPLLVMMMMMMMMLIGGGPRCTHARHVRRPSLLPLTLIVHMPFTRISHFSLTSAPHMHLHRWTYVKACCTCIHATLCTEVGGAGPDARR